MPERDRDRLDIAESVARQLATEASLTPAQARSFVRGLQTSWDVPGIQWRQEESRTQLDDARRLFQTAVIFQKLEGHESASARNCYKRTGEILEWLMRAGDDLGTVVPLELFAAGAYQLGGLPAMAAALLGRIHSKTKGIELYSRFLSADFDGVLASIADFWRENLEITDREASSRLRSEGTKDQICWSLTVELVRALGAIADSLRRGQTARFERALQKLASLDKVAVRALNDETSLLISVLYHVSLSYERADIYRHARALAANHPDRASRVESYARVQYARRRGILWASQQRGLSKLIQESSFALCTPTGSGKTLIANLALLKELLLRDHGETAPLALYLVPSRALAGEVEAKLTRELGNDFTITGLYGGSDWGITDYWLNSNQPTVLIATVEKADALMRYVAPLILTRLRLLIVDEAHQVVPEDDEDTLVDFAEHGNRAIRLEAFVSRLLTLAPGVVRIALTAVAGGAASPVARWIEGRETAEPIGALYRSTRQVIGEFETQPSSTGTMLLEIVNGRPLFVKGRDEPVYLRLRTPPMPPLAAPVRNSIFRFNELDVLWTSLHLTREKRRILISVAQEPERIMGWYKDALDSEPWQDACHFTVPEDPNCRLRFEETRAACIDYCGQDSYELALLERGIATNHGQMPQRLRRLMVDLIDRGVCPITVATATLTEGVNLPFDIIFVTALKRTSYDSEKKRPIIKPISTAEFRNLAGRAGRPGASNGMEGITLVAIPRRPSSTARVQILQQRKQIRSMRNDYDTLRRALLAEELEQAVVETPLNMLLTAIADQAFELFGLREEGFLAWLEAVTPTDITEDAGQASTTAEARLADTLDELDGILLNALEELHRAREKELGGAEAESFLAQLWRKTFTAFATAKENWMEHTFIRRGRALIEHIYPDSNERGRLYQYGFTPCVGRRFEEIAPALSAVISAARQYGALPSQERLSFFEALAEQLVNDRGYGFQIRPTETDRFLLENWRIVLGWWMQAPGIVGPQPSNLRAWQRFITDNLDFRLGVAAGAVVARTWSQGAADPLAIPSLATWRETANLPWFGFWVRELLRWGTLDPFVAFALAQGLARTRDEAANRRQEFDVWLARNKENLDPEDRIDPQRFIAWQQSFPRRERTTSDVMSMRAELTGTTGTLGVYRVIPVVADNSVYWLDSAGFSLARSNGMQIGEDENLYRYDFDLHADAAEPFVDRVFSGS